jgi:lysophospholipase L1-like esterase
MTTALAPDPTATPLLVPLPRAPLDARRPAPPRPRRRPWTLLLLLALLVPALPADAGPERAPAEAVQAYFFGDSLMAGTGASPRRPVMARVAAARLGWQVEVDAWGGTGWTTTGRSPGYLERLRMPGAMAGTYDVVLLEGGTNDARVGSSPAQVRAGVRAVVAEVRRRQPQARIVLMGAYDPPGVLDLRRGVADDAVRAVAAELGLPFVSPWSGRWTQGYAPGPFLDPDGLHPTARGYGVLGERLAASLSAALPDLGSSSQTPQATSSAP